MNTTPKTPLVLLADAADELHKLADRLTDAAEELLPDPQPSANANCPTCSLSFRETVGMVCQTCGTDYAPESTPAQPDEVGWVRMPFEVDICGDIIPADDLITYARRLRTNLSEAERSLKDLETTKFALRTPQPAPVALPTVDEVVDIIAAGGFCSDTAREILALIAARVPVWVTVEPGTVIKAGTHYRIDWQPGRYNVYTASEMDIDIDANSGDGRTWSIDPRTVPAEPEDPRTVPAEPEDPRVAVVREWLSVVPLDSDAADEGLARDLLARLDAAGGAK